MIFMAQWQRMRAIVPLLFVIFTATVGFFYLFSVTQVTNRPCRWLLQGECRRRTSSFETSPHPLKKQLMAMEPWLPESAPLRRKLD
jgi:hypothetical protein